MSDEGSPEKPLDAEEAAKPSIDSSDAEWFDIVRLGAVQPPKALQRIAAAVQPAQGRAAASEWTLPLEIEGSSGAVEQGVAEQGGTPPDIAFLSYMHLQLMQYHPLFFFFDMISRA